MVRVVGWSMSIFEPRIRETLPQNSLESAAGLFATTPFREGTRVYMNTPDGRRVGFTFDPVREDLDPITGFPYPFGPVYRARFTADPGVFERLEVDDVPLTLRPDGTFGLYLFAFDYNPSEYRLITKDGTSYAIDQFQGLLDVTDRNGNVLTVTDAGIFAYQVDHSVANSRFLSGRHYRAVDTGNRPVDTPAAVVPLGVSPMKFRIPSGRLPGRSKCGE